MQQPRMETSVRRARGSMEAEDMANDNGIKEELWLREVLETLCGMASPVMASPHFESCVLTTASSRGRVTRTSLSPESC
jgi:hypothetical protein